MIGIFDSGYGGLTIMREITKALPQYSYLYLGDNARAPYGDRGKKTVTEFTDEAVQYLFERGAKIIIIACFTASSLALRELQEKYLRNPSSKYYGGKILGVVRPVVEAAVGRATTNKITNIGIVGTRATIESGAFEAEIKHYADAAGKKIKISSQACPLLVPLIEEHWHTKPEALMILKKYLRPLKSHNLNNLILGCTHYPLMIKDFKRIMGKRVNVFDSGKIVAESLTNYLKRHPEIESQIARGKKMEFCTTDSLEKFKNFIKLFMQIPDPQASPKASHSSVGLRPDAAPSGGGLINNVLRQQNNLSVTQIKINYDGNSRTTDSNKTNSCKS